MRRVTAIAGASLAEVQLWVHRCPWARGGRPIAVGPSDAHVVGRPQLRRECVSPQGGCRGNCALNTVRLNRMGYEETGSSSLRQDHGGELLVEMAVQDRERAVSACILGVGCSEEEGFSRERSAIPHCVPRGRRGCKGWGPGGAQACQTLLAAGRADELGSPSLEGHEEEVGVEATSRCGGRRWKWRTRRRGATGRLSHKCLLSDGVAEIACERAGGGACVPFEARRQRCRRELCGRSTAEGSPEGSGGSGARCVWPIVILAVVRRVEW